MQSYIHSFKDAFPANVNPGQKLVKEIKYVKPENRKTSSMMTSYEKARLIAVRAQAIENQATEYHNGNLKNEDTNRNIEAAEEELRQKKCPLFISRDIGNGEYERWSPNEMTIP